MRRPLPLLLLLGATALGAALPSASLEAQDAGSGARRDTIVLAPAPLDPIALDSIARAAVRDSILRALVVADSLAIDAARRGARDSLARRGAGVRAARIDSLAAEAARELERAREAARLAESARRDSVARVRAERLGRLRAAVAWAPRRPRQGSLVRLVLPRATDSLGVRPVGGSFAGEPLHFAPDSGGALAALAAIPVDARPGTLVASIALAGDDGVADTLAVSVPVDSGAFRHERLTVRPTYGAEPDSALQARIDREYEEAVAVSRASHERPRLWSGKWVVPRAARVTSGFGNGRQFNGVVQSRHMGVDYAGPAGSPVRASNRGIVALVGDFFLGGNVVYLDHGAGLVTAYLHLQRVDVAVGDTVDAGDRIGLVGNTGRSTGPHLHWVARYGRISVDPRGLLALPAPGARKEP